MSWETAYEFLKRFLLLREDVRRSLLRATPDCGTDLISWGDLAPKSHGSCFQFKWPQVDQLGLRGMPLLTFHVSHLMACLGIRSESRLHLSHEYSTCSLRFRAIYSSPTTTGVGFKYYEQWIVQAECWTKLWRISLPTFGSTTLSGNFYFVFEVNPKF